MGRGLLEGGVNAGEAPVLVIMLNPAGSRRRLQQGMALGEVGEAEKWDSGDEVQRRSFELGWQRACRCRGWCRRGEVPRARWGRCGGRRRSRQEGVREKDGIGQRGAGGKGMGSWERWIGLSLPWRREETRRSGIVGEREVAKRLSGGGARRRARCGLGLPCGAAGP